MWSRCRRTRSGPHSPAGPYPRRTGAAPMQGPAASVRAVGGTGVLLQGWTAVSTQAIRAALIRRAISAAYRFPPHRTQRGRKRYRVETARSVVDGLLRSDAGERTDLELRPLGLVRPVLRHLRAEPAEQERRRDRHQAGVVQREPG